jgi:C-terminal binding protein
MYKPLYVCLDAHDDTIENEVLSEVARVKMLGAKSASELSDSDLSEASVVAVWHTIWIDQPLLARLPRCVAIVRMGVGYDNVDIAAAGRLGISVCNIPDYGTEEVADSALGLTLGLFRGALAGTRLLHEYAEVRGADAIAAAVPYVRRVRGSVLGLIGLGRIGTALALRAKACGFDVVFFDPYREDGSEKAIGIRRATTMAELLRVSDCVSLHANVVSAGVSAEESHAAPQKMLNADAFRQMKRGALLVNTARGEIIDEVALCKLLSSRVEPCLPLPPPRSLTHHPPATSTLAGVGEALKSGQVGAAALDVHWDEPWKRDEGPLSEAPNLFCCPHQAWFSPESRAEMRRKGAQAAHRALFAEFETSSIQLRHLLRNVVNASLLDEQQMRGRLVAERARQQEGLP